MLEVKNLTKIYKPKKGVPVKALNDVSLRFPDTGLVFLLGKSGSGKSTLLNLLGGLDKYDDGEIIIKGVSSKTFRQKHFDSYRNTYLGFIFQEYTILDDFTVGANIALAIELQGRKASNEEINNILEEVDLSGYGARRPNELSGGQKQRVAIARALVKNPKIIMADEPTGALDSVTGKQVLDTLKTLSKDKLVIVVSHDRDFATSYADRIIELADGSVISDITVDQAENTASEGISFEGEAVKIPSDYRLTEEDRLAINAYLDRLQSGGKLEFGAANKRAFKPTNQDTIKNDISEAFRLIKSKLSLKHAFKIGASGLKHKKIRLVMTIILSCVAFVLFGLADTFGAYNHIETCTNSLMDSDIKYATLSKSIRQGEGDFAYWNSWGNNFSDDDVETISDKTGVNLKGIINTDSINLDFSSQYNNMTSMTDSNINIYARSFSGIVEINEQLLQEMDCELLAGQLPDGPNEIAISEYVFKTFEKADYFDGESYTQSGPEYEKINSYDDMVGKKLFFDIGEFTVTGIIDTGLDWERYAPLMEKSGDGAGGEIVDFVLESEFMSAVSNSFSGMIMLPEGEFEKLDYINVVPSNNFWLRFTTGSDFELNTGAITTLSELGGVKITWLDGERTELGEKEIIIPASESRYTAEYTYNEFTGEEIAKYDFSLVKDTEFNMELELYGAEYETFSEEGYKVVGVILDEDMPSGFNYATVVSDDLLDRCVQDSDGKYARLIGAMPKGENDIREFVSYCYDEADGVRYTLNNPVSYELDSINDMLKELSKVFLYIGLGFAVFAAFLLSNFIATSISYKKQEIGILRAIGSRSNDVFRIFFAESFIIAMINFVISCVGVGVVTTVINAVLREQVGLLITILNFSVRQIALILAVSIFVAVAASFLPVKKIASKRPIDAIRGK